MALIRNGSRLVRCFVRCSMHTLTLFAQGLGKDGWSNMCSSSVFFTRLILGIIPPRTAEHMRSVPYCLFICLSFETFCLHMNEWGLERRAGRRDLLYLILGFARIPNLL